MPVMGAAVKRVCQVMALLVCAPLSADAFTAEGHRIVGVIADAYLCPAAREYIRPLLDGVSLADAGVWADAVRDEPPWRHTASWHFIDVTDAESLGFAAARPGNVLWAISHAERELADRRVPLRRRAEALRFLVHFIADVHQPLHVGRPGDRGGNEVTLRWGRESLTLHELWDARLLLKAEGLSTRGLAEVIGALAVGQAARWQLGTELDWAEESRAFRPLVYGRLTTAPKPQLDPGYLATARNVVSLRLAQAGVRVAGRLNQLACPGWVLPPSR